MKKAVYKFNYDCGRMGELTGLFVAHVETVNWLINSNLEIYFGEVLGKHSEIYGIISEDEISFVSDNEEVINVIEKYELENGFSPFDYPVLNTDALSNLIGDQADDDLYPNEVYDLLYNKKGV